jgi:hypothetical protein
MKIYVLLMLIVGFSYLPSFGRAKPVPPTPPDSVPA